MVQEIFTIYGKYNAMKLLSTIAAVMLAATTASAVDYVVETDFGDGHAIHKVQRDAQIKTSQPNDITFFVRSYIYWDNGTSKIVDQRIKWEFDGWKSGSITEHAGPRQRLLFEKLEELIPQDYSYSTSANHNFDAVVIQLNILTNGRGWEAYSRAVEWMWESKYIAPALLEEDNFGATLMNVVDAMYGLRWDNGNWVYDGDEGLHDMRHVFPGTDPLNYVIDGSFPRNISATHGYDNSRAFDEDRMTELNPWAIVNANQ